MKSALGGEVPRHRLSLSPSLPSQSSSTSWEHQEPTPSPVPGLPSEDWGNCTFALVPGGGGGQGCPPPTSPPLWLTVWQGPQIPKWQSWAAKEGEGKSPCLGLSPATGSCWAGGAGTGPFPPPEGPHGPEASGGRTLGGINECMGAPLHVVMTSAGICLSCPRKD